MITKFKKLISMIMKNNDRNNATIFSLAPKIPNTKKGYNIYEKYLKRAFKDPAIKNIAVTGNFGIGKSSFIKWFSRRKKYLFVSLCNFKSNNDSEINSLEFNLVQQLIIGCKSANRNKKRVGFIAFAMTFVFNILLAYFLISTNFMGILDFINNLIVNTDMESVFDKAEKNFYIIIALIYFLGLPILFSNIISHISLKKLSFKTAEIEAELEVRNNQKFSFMDFHRAEVVAILKYYSEKYDYTVVFEDMDRLSFEMCVTVFAELREINRLVNMFPAKLNVAKKTIRFIYVIHDGVFETIGGTSANNTSTQSNNPILNHLKFFDYILPFIPLILNEAASNYFNGCLDEIGFDYSGEFLEIVGKYIYDYRSIHNIINEYCVMRDVYIDDEENEFNTQDQKQLMALAVYKTLMPNDYQKIRIGESIIQKGSNSSNECINRLILNNWLCVECLKYIGLSETEIKKYINGLFKKAWRSERWPVLQNILNSRYDICNHKED